MKTYPALFDQPAPLSNNDSLLVALFFAAVVHVIIGLGVSFSAPKPEKVSRSLDITLVNLPSPKVPLKANKLAQENQEDAGEQTKKSEPPAQPLPNLNNNATKLAKKNAPEPSEPKAEKKLITQTKADKKIVTATKPNPVVQHEKHPQLSAAMLQQQISQLGTEIRLSQQSSEQSKIKYVDAVSSHKYLAAQYMKDWQEKVERTGNLNYPEVAAKKNFSGSLTMDVGINADGSVYSIRINRSSGNFALDEAAKKIVRMSAPFAPLPIDLQKELDVLVITRVWKFSDESGMSSR